MVKYVCGFLLDKALNLVVLIEKQTPEWQKNKWNGVGGKIEPGETPLQAMTREFHEEAGLEITDWHQYCTLRGRNSEINFFYCVMDAEYLTKVRTMTKEQLGIWSIARASQWNFPLLPNIRWILPMALVAIKDKPTEVYEISVEYIDGTK
jgi:8-oxo-dGTP diphosphatase